MARFDTSGLDDLVRDMERMGAATGPVADAMVHAAVIEIRDAWRESAEAHGHRDTGAMIDSIGYSSAPIKLSDAIARDVYPQGKDKKGVRNAEKAFVLHYGSKRIQGDNWVDDADAAAGPRVQAKLEQMWGEFLETGKVPTVVDPHGGVKTSKS